MKTPFYFMSEMGRDLSELLVADVSAGNTRMLNLHKVHELEEQIYHFYCCLKEFQSNFETVVEPNTLKPLQDRVKKNLNLIEKSTTEVLTGLGQLGVLVPKSAKYGKPTGSKNDPTIESILQALPPFSREKYNLLLIDE
jgi:hypothetical protein